MEEGKAIWAIYTHINRHEAELVFFDGQLHCILNLDETSSRMMAAEKYNVTSWTVDPFLGSRAYGDLERSSLGD
eukprot:jgi/Psemu1/35626/gm1.35626_g